MGEYSPDALMVLKLFADYEGLSDIVMISETEEEFHDDLFNYYDYDIIDTIRDVTRALPWNEVVDIANAIELALIADMYESLQHYSDTTDPEEYYSLGAEFTMTGEPVFLGELSMLPKEVHECVEPTAEELVNEFYRKYNIR